jgi:hypothetical protein
LLMAMGSAANGSKSESSRSIVNTAFELRRGGALTRDALEPLRLFPPAPAPIPIPGRRAKRDVSAGAVIGVCGTGDAHGVFASSGVSVGVGGTSWYCCC